MNLKELQKSPTAFRKAILVNSDIGPISFADVMDDWQRDDFEAMDPAWTSMVLLSEPTPKKRAWLERARGHSKTTDEAIMIAWALMAARRSLKGYAAAADKDQAQLLRNAVAELLELNPWLSKILDVQNYRVVNRHTSSTLEILSSDAPTSYGLLPDFVIADEVTHWRNRDLFDSLFSSAAKRKRCVMVCISNAGFIDSWQFEVRENLRDNSHWHFNHLEGSVASWIDTDALDEQRLLLPPTAYSRLWENIWAAGAGDAIDRELIDSSFQETLQPLTRAIEGHYFVAGVDLGVTRDASAIVVLAVKHSDPYDYDSNQIGRIRLCFSRAFRPTPGNKVNLQEIEDTLLSLHRRYRFKAVMYDPWQAVHLAQRLRMSRLPMEELTQSGNNLQAIASATIEAFNDRRLDLYEDDDLRRDLYRLRIEERSYGFRLVSPRDSSGHGDVASAFTFALKKCTELAGKRKLRLIAYGESYDRTLNPIFQRIQKARMDWTRGIHPEERTDITEIF